MPVRGPKVALVRLLAVVAAVLIGSAANAAAAAPACRLSPGQQFMSVATASGVRPVLLYVPVGLKGTSVPLLLNLHGSGSTGAGQLERSGLARIAERHRVILAMPDGGLSLPKGGRAWNIPGVPTTAGALPPAGAPDDVAYVQVIIDRLVGQGCTDRRRVYATGLSGGGRMTSLLGCSLASSIAAIAPVVGLRAGSPLPDNAAYPDPATCRPARPVAVIAFSGDRDTTNPIEGGGADYWQYGLRAAEQRWAEINGCAGAHVHRRGQIVRIRVYDRCSAGVSVVSYVVHGGRHDWDNADLDRMWSFLAAHRRVSLLSSPGR